MRRGFVRKAPRFCVNYTNAFRCTNFWRLGLMWPAPEPAPVCWGPRLGADAGGQRVWLVGGQRSVGCSSFGGVRLVVASTNFVPVNASQFYGRFWITGENNFELQFGVLHITVSFPESRCWTAQEPCAASTAKSLAIRWSVCGPGWTPAWSLLLPVLPYSPAVRFECCPRVPHSADRLKSVAAKLELTAPYDLESLPSR
jgi:hypothetical protein